ncbi:hypothetical protein L596_001610 [Steinernema carpocapsae]|uniref:Uncharacterized protein n=1 Tax=Steinernema carpocapsae TaxID=34508 RepID=A0A4U8ULQ0_STECR|nr:hypothetical protein L596_001610 [Steinernema carpocapsae]
MGKENSHSIETRLDRLQMSFYGRIRLLFINSKRIQETSLIILTHQLNGRGAYRHTSTPLPPLTIIPCWIYAISSDLASQAATGVVSTQFGDGCGIPRVVSRKP